MPIVKRLSLVCIAVVCVLGAALRLGSLATHRTHIDDLGVALTILDARKPGYFQRRVTDRSSPTFDTGAKRRLRELLPNADEPGLVGEILDAVAPSVAVSMSWTYAPLQFIATAALLPDKGTYRQNLFWGRLPSALCGCCALLMLVAVIRRTHREHWQPVALLAVAWFAFSWEHIIFSQQMGSYAIGTLTVLIGVWLHLDVSERLGSTPRRAGSARVFAGYGAAMAVLVYAQYQMLFFGLAALIALAAPPLIHAWRTRSLRVMPLGALIALSATYLVLTLPAAAYIAVKGFTAINWNAGPNGEFAFDWASMHAAPLYFVRFFFGNAVVVTGNLLAFLPESHALRSVLDALVSLTCLLGLIRLVRASSPERRALGLVTVAFAAVWVVLVLTRRMAFGPTRHSLILLPLLLLCMSETWSGLLGWLSRRFAARPWLSPSLSALGVLVISLSFAAQYHTVAAQRRDPFSVERIRAATVERGMIPTVLHDGLHLPLMHELTLRGLPLHSLDSEQRAKLLSEQQPLAVLGVEGETFVELEHELNRAGYRRVYTDETFQAIEVELSQRTRNGFNNYVLYTFEPGHLAAH
jgi:hypothetical protein